MDPAVHKRFLDYRERYSYFGRRDAVCLAYAEFASADAEYRVLAAKGDARDDDDEARFAVLARLLFRD